MSPKQSGDANNQFFSFSQLFLILMVVFSGWLGAHSAAATSYSLSLHEVSVTEVAYTPDSTQVIYGASTSDGIGLYRVPLLGGEAVQIYSETSSAAVFEITDIEISPDSKFVFFEVYRVIDTVDESSVNSGLYILPINGGEARKIESNPSLTLNSQSLVAISPDSSTLLFSEGEFPVTPAQNTYSWKTFSMQMEGGSAVCLSCKIPAYLSISSKNNS